MPEVLILTNPEDAHSFAVQEGLRRKGTEPILWHTADMPTLQTASIAFEAGGKSFRLSGLDLEIEPRAFSSVWSRRPGRPGLPESLDSADQAFAFRECSLFLRSLAEVVGPGAQWVNPPEARAKALLRTCQLECAQKAGFSIPRTLCSNDPGEILRFLRTNPRKVVYKSLFPVTWVNPTGVSVLTTSVIGEQDLPEEALLRATPGIFQDRLDKAYELRVTAIGDHLFAAKIRSQEIPDALLDWRVAGEEVPMEPYELAPEVAVACRKVMSLLGIVFGCFDLVVTRENVTYFLEVNEMGAFLWIERRLPEMRLLDAFCELLVQGRPDFSWRPSASRVRWADVVDGAEASLRAASACHVKSIVD